MIFHAHKPKFTIWWVVCGGSWLAGCVPVFNTLTPPTNYEILTQYAEIGIVPTSVTEADGQQYTVLTTADGQYIGTYPYHYGQMGHCTSAPDGCWQSCCAVHDILYTDGGSEAERYWADAFLRQCINARGGPGDVYFGAVRLFGWQAYNYNHQPSLLDQLAEQP